MVVSGIQHLLIVIGQMKLVAMKEKLNMNKKYTEMGWRQHRWHKEHRITIE